VEKLTFGGLVLGIFEGVSYEGGSVVMEQGDTLIVYSDGVTETWDPDGEEFGEDKLVTLVVSTRSKGADAVQAAILCEIEGFEQGARATDDRTLVVLKREERA
jgi:sigma-B regulation protein RsbU (phosphoserine phosphatase)